MIRRAEFDDVNEMFALMVRAHEEDHPHYPPPKMPYAVQAMLDLIAVGFVWVMEKDGFVVGLLALEAAHWPWNPDVKHFNVQHFYVHPEHRGRESLALLDKAIEAARGIDVDLVVPVTGGVSPVVMERLISRKGGRLIGTTHLFPCLHGRGES